MSVSGKVFNTALTVISLSPFLADQPMRPLKATATTSQPVLTIQQVDTIFYKIQDIFEIHKEFYDALLPSIQQWDEKVTVGHLFQKLVSLTTTVKPVCVWRVCVFLSPSSTAKVPRPSLTLVKHSPKLDRVLSTCVRGCCGLQSSSLVFNGLHCWCGLFLQAKSVKMSLWTELIIRQASACVVELRFHLMSCTAREGAISNVHININNSPNHM